MQIKVIRNHITPVRMHVSDPMDCSLPGSSVHQNFQVRTLDWLPFPSPRDFPNPGIKSMSLASPALVGGLFTNWACQNGNHQKHKNNKCCQGCGEKGPLCTVGGNVNWCSTVENRIVVPQKIKTRTTIWSSNSTLGYLYKENENTNWKGYLLQHCLQQPRYGNKLNILWQMNG